MDNKIDVGGLVSPTREYLRVMMLKESFTATVKRLDKITTEDNRTLHVALLSNGKNINLDWLVHAKMPIMH